jgi:putative ABC transport system ATP-binding protein
MTVPTVGSSSVGTAPAARTVDATIIYGRGEVQVRPLDEVTVEYAGHGYTAIMGPSGSGKSTLLHCSAGLDTLTAGQAFIGEIELGPLDDDALTILRRDHVGFVFPSTGYRTPAPSAGGSTLRCCPSSKRPREWPPGRG